MTMTPAMLKAALEGRNVDATPSGIMRSERTGQQALVASTDMPNNMSPSREAFEKVGFKFGEAVDELFLKATLPSGWTRAATDHSMHSDVLDEKGRKRVGVFYKAAFYDRRADAWLERRFKVTWLFPDENGGGLAKDERAYIVTDAGLEIYRTPSFKQGDWDADKRHRAVADAWLAEAAPNADDPTAYW